MNKTFTFSLVAAMTLIMSGCAIKTGNMTLEKMEKSHVNSQIIKGKSTKEEIIAIMGDPDRADFDNNGDEKWTYSHLRKDSKGVNFFPIISWFVSGTNDTTKTLTILFNTNDTIKNYTFTDAKGETKMGLFQ
jgi:hypothetical protein